MFEIDNKKIGKYLSNLIDRHFKSKRQFCKEYLKYQGIVATDEATRKMANRVSQILKGAKSIQTYDLPIFTELLSVCCEEILSAGEYSVTGTGHITNYSIAHSKSEETWKQYIEREDKLILNPDEYGKTAIDYAIECGNYNFLKFLMDNNYIWFDSGKDSDYFMTFGAGTSIKRRNPLRIDDYLQYELSMKDALRMEIISLAVDHNDIKALSSLRARELPEMYYDAHYLNFSHPDFEKSYDINLVRHIAGASDDILAYFTDEFEIKDYVKYKDGSKRTHKFMFPYLSQLLDLLIDRDSSYLEKALKKAIQHNESTYNKLNSLIKQSVNNGYYNYNDWKNELYFYKNGDIISFRDGFAMQGIITNVVRTTRKPKDVNCYLLTEQLNSLYTCIRNIKE